MLGELASGLRRAVGWQRAVAWRLALVALVAVIATAVAGRPDERSHMIVGKVTWAGRRPGTRQGETVPS